MISRKNPKVDLERKRKIFLEIGFIVSILLVIAAFEYRTYDTGDKNVFQTKYVLLEEEHTQVTIQKPPPPPELPKQKPQVIKVVDDHKEVTDSPPEFDAADASPVKIIYRVPDMVEPDIEEDRIFVGVEEVPEFPGGYSALMKYLAKAIKYPRVAKEMGISGTVYIKFVIEKNGLPTNLEVLRGVEGGCTEEALKAVKNMPAWSPGKQWGKAVRCQFTLPVKFTLK